MKEQFQNKSSIIFEIIETGISKHIFRKLDNSHDLALNREISQILTILSLGERREMKKLINSGLIQLLVQEIQKSPDSEIVTNCVMSLGNISSTHIEFRNKIIAFEPKIFSKLKSFVSQRGIQKEIAYFVASMIRRDRISIHEFESSYSEGIEILSVCLNQFDFSNEHTKETEQYLYEIINSFCVLNEMVLSGAVKDPLIHDMSKLAAIKVDEAVNRFNLF